MGGFQGKKRRQQSARGIISKLVKAGTLTADEGKNMRNNLAKTGRLGTLKTLVKLKSNTRGKKTYQVTDFGFKKASRRASARKGAETRRANKKTTKPYRKTSK